MGRRVLRLVKERISKNAGRWIQVAQVAQLSKLLNSLSNMTVFFVRLHPRPCFGGLFTLGRHGAPPACCSNANSLVRFPGAFRKADGYSALANPTANPAVLERLSLAPGGSRLRQN
jgi:hypothetical protein